MDAADRCSSYDRAESVLPGQPPADYAHANTDVSGPGYSMTMPRHRVIEQRREQLGIGIAEFAHRIGVSPSEYQDVESHDDELTMVLPLANARSLAAILGFELGTLLGAGAPVGGQNASDKSRHVILAEARQRLGVSPREVADEIGFEEVFVHSLENDGRVLETYSSMGHTFAQACQDTLYQSCYREYDTVPSWHYGQDQS